MSNEQGFSVREIVGIAAAGGIALGGIVVALARSQDRQAGASVGARVAETVNASVVDRAAATTNFVQEVAQRLARAYPDVRRELEGAAHRARSEFEAGRDTVGAFLAEHAPDDLTSRLAAQTSAARERVEGAIAEALDATPSVKRFADVASQFNPPPHNRLRDSAVSIALIAAASALVYLVLESPKRREALKTAFCRALETVQTLTDDFRGCDDGY